MTKKKCCQKITKKGYACSSCPLLDAPKKQIKENPKKKDKKKQGKKKKDKKKKDKKKGKK